MSDVAYPRSFGAYQLLERLGAGGMSEVDLARKAGGDASLVRFVVIKRMRSQNAVDEQYVRMFQDEARINAELSHENIAQVYDFGREGDEFYMAMEYVPGLDLRAIQLALAQKNRLIPPRIALTILCGVLRALQYAHARVDQLGQPMNIVHRDVNPRNVMVSVNGEVKLIDFGVAKAADRLEKTEGNQVKGKFAYMAPEQVEGPRIDGRADLYAVGLMFHELLTGRSPFTGLTEVQIIHRLLSGRIAPLPDGVAHPDLAFLRAIHARALAVRPEERYPTADAFRADLERALQPLGGLAPASWVADLLKEAKEDVVTDIARRLRSYRDGAALPAPSPRPPAPIPDSSGTLNVSSLKTPPIGWMAVVFGVGGLGVGALAVVLLIVGGVVWWRSDEPGSAGVTAEAKSDAARTATGAGGEGAGSATASPETMNTTVGTGTGSSGAKSAGSPSGKAVATAGGAGTAGPAIGSGASATIGSGSGAKGAGTGTTSGGAVATTHPSGSGTVPTRGSTGDDATARKDGASAGSGSATVASAAGTPGTTGTSGTTGSGAATDGAATAPATSAATSTAPAAADGFLNLTSRPDTGLEVLIDGRSVGVTPLRMKRQPPGTYEVVVRNPATGEQRRKTVTVASGVASELYVVSFRD